MRKVSVSRNLMSITGLPLSSAHEITCRLLDGDTIPIHTNSPAVAETLYDRLSKLGVICHIDETDDGPFMS